MRTLSKVSKDEYSCEKSKYYAKIKPRKNAVKNPYHLCGKGKIELGHERIGCYMGFMEVGEVKQDRRDTRTRKIMKYSGNSKIKARKLDTLRESMLGLEIIQKSSFNF